MRPRQQQTRWRIVLVSLLALVSCSSTGDIETVSVPTLAAEERVADEESVAGEEPASFPTAEPRPPPVIATAPTETAMPQEASTVHPNKEVDPVQESEPAPDCVTIADFSTAQANAEWVVVNDNVMGGRSLGNRAFADETMTFAGAINTNGGGFASLRLPLPPEILSSVHRIEMRARADGRNYLLTFDDSLEGRNRRISFRGPLEFTTPGQWETVSVRLADLYAASFGQTVVADPFRPDLATRIGIMLSDGVDGDFVLDIDYIKACS